MEKHATNSRLETSGFHVLQRKPALNVWQSLLVRALLVLALVSIALAGHWNDRDGLRDNIDGRISFSDVVYFTTITVTTVGYGDIVPVSNQARMFDTFVVTPIRIFVWLIFLGTAYDFVLKRTFERVRTAMIRKSLSRHIILCGFGAKGEYAARELMAGTHRADQLVVIDSDPERVALAIAMDFNAIHGDATQNDTLKAARIEDAGAVLISTSKDDTAALVVLSARQLNPDVAISVTARAQENEDLLYQAGATFVLNPVRIGGHLLARAGAQHNAVNYLADLASAEGGVLLRERPAVEADLDRHLRDVETGVGLRLLRAGERVADGPECIVRRGDLIIEIVDTGRKHPE